MELDDRNATKYRAIVARGNYLSQDRSDIQFATKELSRAMARPTNGDWKKLKRLGRYLKGRPRAVTEFKYQQNEGRLVVWTDTDFAGCRKTRKSTSGGVAMWGSCVLKTWSSTQAVVALSSGEAEYYGLVKGGAQALGIQAMLQDLGIKLSLLLKTDASAACGIVSRKGLGKVRHLEVSQLWLQDKGHGID